MDKYLASYIFVGDTLFNIDKQAAKPMEDNPNTEIKTTPVEEQPSVFITAMPVVVIVDSINVEEKEMLAKILAAASLNYQTIDFVDYSTLNKKLSLGEKTAKVMFFGINPKVLNIPFSPVMYQVQASGNSQLLIVDKIAKLFKNENEEKKKLWTAMKTLFEV